MSELLKTEDVVYNGNGVALKPTSKVFSLEDYDLAVAFARDKRSYFGPCYNHKHELIGYYVPV